MKKFKRLVIGGIETKVVNLILVTVILMITVYALALGYQTKSLSELTAKTSEKQQDASRQIISATMDAVMDGSMSDTTGKEARIVDEMFGSFRARVTLLAQLAEAVLSDAETYPPKPYSGPDPAMDGTLYAQVLLADGVDEAAIRDRIGQLANLSPMMISLCNAFGADNVYVATPEGAFLSVNKTSSSWLRDGKVISYDARTRDWYRLAAAAAPGEMIIHANVEDANTGDFCVECAMGVYADGKLQAVVGSDIFRRAIEEVLQPQKAADSAEKANAVEAGAQEGAPDSGYRIIIDGEGRVIYSSDEEIFRTYGIGQENSVLDSENQEFLRLLRDAAEGNSGTRLLDINGSGYYMVGVPITPAEGVKWVLLSAYAKERVDQPEIQLLESNAGIQQEAVKTYQTDIGQAKTRVMIVLGALTVLMLASAVIVGKRIVRPLNTITKRISELDTDNLEFKMEDTFRTSDEIEVLAQSFAAISHRTVEYLDEVQRVTAEKERIGTELHMANQIQESMLPSIFPAFPDRPEFDIYASMDPAKEVGGDFYDFFLIDDDHLCMVMADVSGKGVPGALFMMASKIIIQSCAMLGTRSTAEILAKTNEAICSNNQEGMFVTVWLGILEISTGKLTAANAGHEYPALKQGDGYALYKDRHGLVIGGMEGVKYRDYTIQLKPGDKLFLYTDGVPEATDSSEDLFGTDRMLEALNRNPEADPKALLSNVRDAVDAFVGNAEQFDDLTMLCVEYKGVQKKCDASEG